MYICTYGRGCGCVCGCVPSPFTFELSDSVSSHCRYMSMISTSAQFRKVGALGNWH